MLARNKIQWDSVMSPFRHYENGIAHGGELYPTPMHVLVVLMYGEDFYRKMVVLDNYDAIFIAKITFCMKSDTLLHELYKGYFTLPQNIHVHASTIAHLVINQYPLLLSEVVANRVFADSILQFCTHSPLLNGFCESFRVSFVNSK